MTNPLSNKENYPITKKLLFEFHFRLEVGAK